MLDTLDDETEVVFPKYRYARGWPIAVAPSLWEVLLRLEGGLDLPVLLSSHTNDIGEVWLDRIAPPIYEGPDDLTRSP